MADGNHRAEDHENIRHHCRPPGRVRRPPRRGRMAGRIEVRGGHPRDSTHQRVRRVAGEEAGRQDQVLAAAVRGSLQAGLESPACALACHWLAPFGLASPKRGPGPRERARGAQGPPGGGSRGARRRPQHPDGMGRRQRAGGGVNPRIRPPVRTSSAPSSLSGGRRQSCPSPGCAPWQERRAWRLGARPWSAPTRPATRRHARPPGPTPR